MTRGRQRAENRPAPGGEQVSQGGQLSPKCKVERAEVVRYPVGIQASLLFAVPRLGGAANKQSGVVCRRLLQKEMK